MKKILFLLLLISAHNKLHGMAQRAANAARTAITTQRAVSRIRPQTIRTLHQSAAKNLENNDYLKGSLTSLPRTKQCLSPAAGAIHILTDLKLWPTCKGAAQYKVFDALFNSLDNNVRATVAPGNPASSLNPAMVGEFVEQLTDPRFDPEHFINDSEFIKNWHLHHVKETGRYEKFKDFKAQAKRLVNALQEVSPADRTRALASLIYLKSATREDMLKALEKIKDIDLGSCKQHDQFDTSNSSFQATKELLEAIGKNPQQTYTPQELEEVIYWTLATLKKPEIRLLYAPFEHASYQGKRVPPCAEISLRTFINLLLFDPKTQTLSLSRVPEGLVLDPQFKSFIEKYANVKTPNYFHTSKDEWVALLSDRKGIKYIQSHYELETGMKDALATLNLLFGAHAQSLEEFASLFSTEENPITIKGKNQNYGTYKITTKTLWGVWIFNRIHAGIELRNLINQSFELPALRGLKKISCQTGINLIDAIPKKERIAAFPRDFKEIETYGTNSINSMIGIENILDTLNLSPKEVIFSDGINLLGAAICAKKLQLIEPLLKAGVNPNEQDLHEDSFLIAVRSKNPEALKALLEACANLNIKGDLFSALKCALQNDALEMIKLLINAGAQVNPPFSSPTGFTPLEIAIRQNSFEAAKLLIESGADVNPKTRGYTPLLMAITTNNVAMVELLIAAGAELNHQDIISTPLIVAIDSNNRAIVKLLISAGAKVNSQARYYTPLQRAIELNNLAMAQLLIEAGADINPETTGYTPLESAINKNNLDMVKLLVGAGAKLFTNSYSSSPMERAAREGRVEIAKFLYDNGGYNDFILSEHIPPELRAYITEKEDAKRKAREAIRKAEKLPKRLDRANRWAEWANALQGSFGYGAFL